MSQLIKSKQEIDNDIFIYANKTGEITHSAAYCTCSYTAQCGALPFDLVIFLSLADTTAGAGRVMALCHQLMLRLVSFSPPPLDKLPSPTATEPANQPAHRTAPHRVPRSVRSGCPVLSCAASVAIAAWSALPKLFLWGFPFTGAPVRLSVCERVLWSFFPRSLIFSSVLPPIPFRIVIVVLAAGTEHEIRLQPAPATATAPLSFRPSSVPLSPGSGCHCCLRLTCLLYL